MMSSAKPSAKCSCSGSPLRLAKGRTAIEGPRAGAPSGADASRRVTGANEAVADARDRGDPVAAVGRGAEQPAERRDLHREVALLDDHAAPAGVEQLGFGEDVAGSPQHLGQEKRRAIAHRHRHALSQQRSGVGVKDEGTEGEVLPGHLGEATPICACLELFAAA